MRFIDAKQFVYETVNKQKLVNDSQLNLIVRSKIESESLKIVSNSTIIEFDYNINVPRYFAPEIEIDSNVRLEKLGELVRLVRGQRNIENQSGKFVRIRDLKDDKLDCQLNLSGFEQVKIPSAALKISEACLLLATQWKTLKPTYFKYSMEPIYIIPNIIALKVDETKVDINYLMDALHADYVTEQIESYRIGTVIPSIRREDLLNVKIRLPSLEEQKGKILGLKEAVVKMKLLEAERNALAHGMGNLIYENFSSVKHSLGKPLLNIGSSLRNIENALSKINKEWETEKLSERMDVTLKDSFNSIYSNLELVHSLLKNNYPLYTNI